MSNLAHRHLARLDEGYDFSVALHSVHEQRTIACVLLLRAGILKWVHRIASNRCTLAQVSIEQR